MERAGVPKWMWRCYKPRGRDARVCPILISPEKHLIFILFTQKEGEGERRKRRIEE
jgi:hypothetical protein